ncbi:MAG: RecB family exonuclease [Nanoarchaeota archaeon]
MGIYSHSKLSTFEQCPYKFKLRYLDRIKPPIEATIEAHLGSVVHDSLEWLYHNVKNNRIPSIEELIDYYGKKWQEKFSDKIHIKQDNMTEKDFFNKGVKFLIDYYVKNKPFDDGTLELEKQVQLYLGEDNKHKIRGFIDRLVYNAKTGEYEVHDYKTANSMPLQEKFDNDRQLALYSIAIKEIYGKNKKVCLIWHYLAHNKKICSYRTDEQLEDLKKEILRLISEIESAKSFPTKTSKLCEWCEYKSMCPEWNS